MPVWYYDDMKKKADIMTRTAMFLKPEQVEKLQKLSDLTGAPVAELIRRAIDAYLKQRAKELS